MATARRTLPPSSRDFAAGLSAVLVATALLTGCSSAAATSAPISARSASSSPTAVAVRCHRLPPATLPRSAGSLTQADAGAFCLRVGQRVDVFLAAPKGAAQGTRWRAIGSSSPQVLAPVGTGVMTAPLGVTPGLFVARSPGVSTLTSTCPDGTSWRATLVVS
ncbi:hypothetical protein [Streptomyces sp. Ru72]|uniref:hypothetical protein n=1 Tax=Streptomyces sp. Ru72 TaxID=2080747 RepID=UPI000CDD59F7|nr:hypothetical protein [Streptomyces sp. Ru72]POX52812.1 hypothetical protein C3488_07200 [Streptomyces sp. Ru72]